MSTPFDAAAFADRILLEQSNLVRERFEDGTVVYYDFRMAEPEVNDPGPEIAVIPSTLDGEMFVRLDRAVRREAVFAAMRYVALFWRSRPAEISQAA